jgi:hypothetical protein
MKKKKKYIYIYIYILYIIYIYIYVSHCWGCLFSLPFSQFLCVHSLTRLVLEGFLLSVLRVGQPGPPPRVPPANAQQRVPPDSAESRVPPASAESPKVFKDPNKDHNKDPDDKSFMR